MASRSDRPPVAPAKDAERAVRVLLVIEDRALANTIDLTLRHGGYLRRSEASVDAARGVIALTRRSDLRGKLDAFERGADDYIGVPFVPDDLVARTRAVIRRTHGKAGELVPRLRIGDLEIDVLNRKVL